MRHYSGGRYMAYSLSVALSELGHDVTVYADRRVPFSRDFIQYRRPKTVIQPLYGGVQDIPKHDLFIGLPMVGSTLACQLGVRYKVPSVVCVLDVLPLMQKYREHRGPALSPSFWDGMLNEIRYSRSHVFVLADWNRKPAADWIGIPIERVFTVYPAVNDRVIDSLPEIERQYRACFISRLEPHKKLPHAIDAVKFYGIHLDIVTAQADRDLIDTRDMRDYATFHIGVDDMEKFSILMRSRFLIFPSTWEGFGMPVVEALACKTPVVCYRFPTFEEVVSGSEYEKYVYFAKYGDREDLARQVARCAREGYSGRFVADKRFGMNQMMVRLARILQEIV